MAVYPFMTIDNDIEVVHTELRADNTVEVYFEQPVESGFNSVECIIPEYRWEKNKGFNEEQLAEVLYLDNKATISSYENNRRMLSADILSEMARVQGTSIDYLLNGEKEENETINQVVQIMEVLSPELQKVALAQVRVLSRLYQQNNKQMF